MGRFGGKYRILSCSLRGGTPGPQKFAMTFLTAIHTSLDTSPLGVDSTFLGSLMIFWSPDSVFFILGFFEAFFDLISFFDAYQAS